MSIKYPKKLEEISCGCTSGFLLPEYKGKGMAIGHCVHCFEGNQHITRVYFLLVSE